MAGFWGSVIGGPIIFLCLTLLTAQTRMRISFDNNIYRQYTCFFWLIKIGKWKQLKDYDVITIVPTSDKWGTYLGFRNFLFFNDRSIVLNLRNGPREKLTFARGKYSSLKNLAAVLGKEYGLEVKDFVEQEDDI